jgi:hypothetical protein
MNLSEAEKLWPEIRPPLWSVCYGAFVLMALHYLKTARVCKIFHYAAAAYNVLVRAWEHS